MSSAASGPATLEQLRAPRLTSTSGVTLGGQSFGRLRASAAPDGGALLRASAAPDGGALSTSSAAPDGGALFRSSAAPDGGALRTTTGRLAGRSSVAALTASKGGYVFTLPAGSAELVTLP